MRPVHERGAESVLAKMGSEHGGCATQRIALRIICPREPIPPRRTTRCKRRLETMKFQNDG